MSAGLSPLLALRAGILARLGARRRARRADGRRGPLYDEPPRGAAAGLRTLFGDGEVHGRFRRGRAPPPP